MSWQVACKASEVPAGEAIAVELDDNFIAIYNVDGEYYATDDTCSHEEASLVDGFLEGDLIECPLHGSQFNVKTGEVLSPPAVMPIKSYPTMLEGDAVLVDLAGAST